MKKSRIIIILIVLNVFIGSGLYLLKDKYDQMDDQKKVYNRINTYTSTTDNNKEIDFDALLKENEDVIGWIYIPDTKVDEPILKGETNDTYLRTNLEGKHQISGSIFIDHINNTDFNDIQTIIYGHHMRNGTKFSVLEDYMKESYLQEHNKIYIYTPSVNYTYTVIASAEIRKNSYLYANEVTVYDLLTNADICEITDKDTINHCIMLSTCVSTGSSDRYVVWASRDE